MTAKKLTSKLYDRLLEKKPISIRATTPTLDELRALISAEFKPTDDAWKITAPKVVQSR